MNERLALLCPGQASQQADMFGFAHKDAAVAAMLEDWLAPLCEGRPLDAVLAQESLMFANRMAQPLVVAATLANWMALRRVLPAPYLAMGYSIGELASWAVAGAISPRQAVALAAQRAAAMDSCIAAGAPQTMASVTVPAGADWPCLLQAHGFAPAIVIDADSMIAGGPLAGLDALAAALAQAGGRVARLPVGIASHTYWMRDAVHVFVEQLGNIDMLEPRCAVTAGISGELQSRKEQALSSLPRQLAEPIRWDACMDACAEAGVTVALELGPGVALSRMLQARHAHIECRSVADFRSVTGIGKWLQHRFG